MSDLFHEEVSIDFIRQVFQVMAEAEQHIFQVLTKRHDRLRVLAKELIWPQNVWMGVSVENQYWADRRIPALLEVPASIRFLSVEPMLRPIDLRPYLDDLQWVIVGGESGPKARRIHPDWVETVRDHCLEAGVPFFFKQWGGRTSKSGGNTLDSRTWEEMPYSQTNPQTRLKQEHGGLSPMPPREAIWTIEPHTIAKHEIIKKYWQAWLPIMSSRNSRVLYIDGFAGPGVYKGGEPGSPVIALDAAINHKASIKSEVVFLFIEDDKQRSDNLSSILANKDLPANFKCRVHNSKFDETMTEILKEIEEQSRRLAPAFALVDPFGYSDTPFEVIKEMLRNSKCEVLITFMYQFINRFISEKNQWDNWDRLYGTQDWRGAIDVSSPEERKSILHGVYKRQLEQNAGAKYVLPFEMEDSGGRTEYFLFFCTNSLDGLKKMKAAMWSVDPSGAFRYAYSSNPDQLQLFSPEPDFSQLRKEIVKAFSGKKMVPVEEIGEFVLVKTPFRETHYKKKVLVELETEGQIEATHPKKKRTKNSYPEGTLISFNDSVSI